MKIHDPLMRALNALYVAEQEVEVQCWDFDQLARELHDEFQHRYKGPDCPYTGWMSAYMGRLARYTTDTKEETSYVEAE